MCGRIWAGKSGCGKFGAGCEIPLETLRPSMDAVVSSKLPNSRLYFFEGGGGGGGGGRVSRPWQAGKARSPKGNREISQNQGSELSSATIVPRSNVVADIPRSAYKVIPGNAAGTATPVGIPVCYWSTRKTEMIFFLSEGSGGVWGMQILLESGCSELQRKECFVR